jgi:hypothetical protein
MHKVVCIWLLLITVQHEGRQCGWPRLYHRGGVPNVGQHQRGLRRRALGYQDVSRQAWGVKNPEEKGEKGKHDCHLLIRPRNNYQSPAALAPPARSLQDDMHASQRRHAPTAVHTRVHLFCCLLLLLNTSSILCGLVHQSLYTLVKTLLWRARGHITEPKCLSIVLAAGEPQSHIFGINASSSLSLVPTTLETYA